MLAAAQSTGYAFLFRHAGHPQQGTSAAHPDHRHADRGDDAPHVDRRADHQARRRQRHLAPDLRVDPRRARPPASRPGCTAAPTEKLFFPIIALGVVVAVVFVQEGQRRIPIQYAQADGRPPHDDRRIDVHAAAREHGRRDPGHLRGGDPRVPADDRPVRPAEWNFVNSDFGLELPYLLTEAVLIVIFTFFYTAVQFNPVDQADNLRSNGGYIPGIRPGPADGALPRPRDDPADAAGRALPRGDRGRCRASSSSTAASRRRPRARSAARPC